MGCDIKGKLKLAGFFTAFTGLNIGKDKGGSSNSSVPRLVARHPITSIPFIPASSLRGAVRRSLERQYALENDMWLTPHNCCSTEADYQQNPICRILGVSSANIPKFNSKVLFRDALLTEESIRLLQTANCQSYLADIKIYASMDRITSQGNSYAIEQIPAGCQFQFEIYYTIYGDSDIPLFKTLLNGMKDLEASTLGSNGSRGLGKIRFGQWPMNETYCIQEEPVSGLSLFWYPKQYYTSGSGDLCLLDLQERCGIEDLISQYEDRIAAKIN